LGEFMENIRSELFWDAKAPIAHFHADVLTVPSNGDRYCFPLGGEFGRVGQEVGEDLHQAIAIYLYLNIV